MDGLCSVPDCTRETESRGWCRMHYTRWRRTGDPLLARTNGPRPDPNPPQCSVEECGERALAKELCAIHYSRQRRHGDPEVVKRRWGRTEAERFWDYVNKTARCWLWTGGKSHGYGTFYVAKPGDGYRQVMAHRFAWTLLVGPIPDGLTLDHLKDRCGNRHCVKVVADEHGPAHLEPVTLRVNIQRGGNGQKTHCKRGHEFTPENTYVMKGGGRSCRICLRLHGANTRARHHDPDTPLNPVEANRAKTHCKRGHPFDEANTYRIPRTKLMPNGGRSCRTCNREKTARLRAAARPAT